MPFFYAVIGILVLTSGVEAEKWGKVSKEVLQMESIPEDPDADAIILFDRGDLEIDHFEVNFTRHRRIKILTKAGVDDYADVDVPFWHEDKIRKLEAQTFLPDGSKIKLNKRDIQETKSTNYKRKIFAIPGVVPGAVIEYRYTRRSKHLYFVEPLVLPIGQPDKTERAHDARESDPAIQHPLCKPRENDADRQR